MPRPHAIVLLLVTTLAVGCGERRRRGAPSNFVAAEVTTPLHVSVRVYEEDVKPPCTETGLARFRCFFQNERVGCTVLELGDEPAEPSPVTLACAVPRDGGRRLLLSATRYPASGMQLFVDPEGTRIAWRAGPDKPLAVFYVLDGELLESPDNAGAAPPDAPMLERPSHLLLPTRRNASAAPPATPMRGETPDWAMIPPLSAQAESLLPRARPSQLVTLLSLVHERRGEVGLGEALALSIANANSRPWRDAFNALRPEGRAAWNAAIAEALADDPGSSVLNRLMENPDLRPPKFADLLAQLVEADLAAGWPDSDDVPQFIDALLALGDARAGPLACGWLEQEVSATLIRESDDMPEKLEAASPVLVAIARKKTRCPWVKLALDRDPCNPNYRCTKAGFVEASDETLEPEHAAANGAAVLSQNPLCTPAQAKRLADTVKPPWSVPGDEADHEETPASPVPVSTLLLAAGYAQSALPAAFVRRNERRRYRVDNYSRGVAGVESEDTASRCDFSRLDVADPAEIACRVPAEINRIALSGCRIDIDDARRVITVTPTKPLPSSSAGDVRRRGDAPR